MVPWGLRTGEAASCGILEGVGDCGAGLPPTGSDKEPPSLQAPSTAHPGQHISLLQWSLVLHRDSCIFRASEPIPQILGVSSHCSLHWKWPLTMGNSLTQSEAYSHGCLLEEQCNYEGLVPSDFNLGQFRGTALAPVLPWGHLRLQWPPRHPLRGGQILPLPNPTFLTPFQVSPPGTTENKCPSGDFPSWSLFLGTWPPASVGRSRG